MGNALFKTVGSPAAGCLDGQASDRTWSDIVACITSRIREAHAEAPSSMKELILGCVDLLSKWSYNSCSVSCGCPEDANRSYGFTRGELNIFYGAPELEKSLFTEALIRVIEDDGALLGHGLLHHIGDIKRSRLLNSEKNGDQFMGMDIVVLSDAFGSSVNSFSDLGAVEIASLIKLVSKVRDRNLFAIIVSDIPIVAGLSGRIKKMNIDASDKDSILELLDRTQESDICALSAWPQSSSLPRMSPQ